MKAFLGYALAGGALVALGGLVVTSMLAPREREAIWYAGGISYGIQIAAFAALLAARGRTGAAFLSVWVLGTLLRMAAVLGAGLWLARTAAMPPAPLLLGMAAFLMLLLFLEPVFFRVGMPRR